MKPFGHPALIQILKSRFEKNMHRHQGIAWAVVEARLEGNVTALTSLGAMETSGGEPDVIGESNSGYII